MSLAMYSGFVVAGLSLSSPLKTSEFLEAQKVALLHVLAAAQPRAPLVPGPAGVREAPFAVL